MRIPKKYYTALKRLHDNQGSTKEVTIEELDWLFANRLVDDKSSNTAGYKIVPNFRGEAAIQDRPIE